MSIYTLHTPCVHTKVKQDMSKRMRWILQPNQKTHFQTKVKDKERKRFISYYIEPMQFQFILCSLHFGHVTIHQHGKRPSGKLSTASPRMREKIFCSVLTILISSTPLMPKVFDCNLITNLTVVDNFFFFFLFPFFFNFVFNVLVTSTLDFYVYSQLVLVAT